MKRLLQSALIGLLTCTSAFGGNFDEGMWLPLLLKKMNYPEMQKMGLKLTAEQLYDVNNASLKDAIVSFGGFCTGEIVSKEGLVLTNHHCGYDAISSLSTVQHPYLDSGFWAMSRGEEIPAPGLFVNILVRMEDVSERVKKEIEGVADKDRATKLSEVYKTISDEAIKGTHYNANVREMYNGLEFYLFVYERFNDIRLVGTPPQSIGKFGGDTDNWMWPRHTGDFSIFRIYASAENKPAPYSPDNKPYTPKHHIPVSLKGVKPADFTMTYGYPGRTSRYLTSYGVRLSIEEVNPAVIKILGKRLEVMKKHMDAADSVRFDMAGDYASIANSWKYYIGQTEGLNRLKLLDYKIEEERRFNEWVNSDPERIRKYADVTSNIGTAYGNLREVIVTNQYLNAALNGSRIIGIARSFKRMEDSLKSRKTLTAEEKNKYRQMADDIFEDYHASAERDVLAAMLTLYAENIPADKQVPYVQEILKKYKGKTVAESCNKFAADMFAKSIYASKTKFVAFLEKPSASKIQKDPASVYLNKLLSGQKSLSDAVAAANLTAQRQSMLLIEGMREMNPNKAFYPDANGTPRLSYGKVINYSPKDAVEFDYKTTLKGVIEKEDTKNPEEFTVPAKLKQLYMENDYGMYAENGVLPVGFISDNDITGGNSGSPVINGSGQLVGIAFDGNWEAMTGDIVYDKDLKRCINVDIRYVLFIIDKFGGAPHIVNEMTIVK